MKKNEVAKEVLLKEYYKLGGKVFAEVFIRTKAIGEDKKTLESMDFLNALITGEGIKEDWKLEKSKHYEKLLNLVETINKLYK